MVYHGVGNQGSPNYEKVGDWRSEALCTKYASPIGDRSHEAAGTFRLGIFGIELRISLKFRVPSPDRQKSFILLYRSLQIPSLCSFNTKVRINNSTFGNKSHLLNSVNVVIGSRSTQLRFQHASAVKHIGSRQNQPARMQTNLKATRVLSEIHTLNH